MCRICHKDRVVIGEAGGTAGETLKHSSATGYPYVFARQPRASTALVNSGSVM